MADIELGLDLFSSGIGLESDDADGIPPLEEDASPPPGPGSGSVAVPEYLGAGFLPRDVPGPAQRASGSGFASGDVLDTAPPGPAVAGLVDAAAGSGRAYAGLDDDELIGALVAWQKTKRGPRRGNYPRSPN